MRFRSVQFLIVALLALGLTGMHPLTTFAATTVSDCPTTESGLRTDISNAGSGGTVAFTCTGDTTIPFDSTIFVGQSVTLDASGATGTVTFDGGGKTQLFIVYYGVPFTVKGLTLAHGSSSDYGGAILSFGTVTVSSSTFSSNSATSYGGAITVAQNRLNTASISTLTITGCTFSHNSASDGGAIYTDPSTTTTITNSTLSGNSAPVGGAIFSVGLLTVRSSTFSVNSASSYAGAIMNYGTLTVSSSTFFANSASSSFGGGAIYNANTTSITDSTLSGNSAPHGGAIYNSSGTVRVGGTIITNSSGGNCTGQPITDAGYNLSDDSSCGFSAPNHDLINTYPQLGPLQNNGGPTQTMALFPTSPAINQIPTGTPTLCPASGTDQRGSPRPDAGENRCDIGAYESSYTASTSSPHVVVTVLASTPCTSILSNVSILPGGSATGRVVIQDERPGGIPCAPTRPGVQSFQSVRIASLVCTSHTTATIYGQVQQGGPGGAVTAFREDVVMTNPTARINGSVSVQTSSGYSSGVIPATVHISGC